jgi:hypothetical protein
MGATGEGTGEGRGWEERGGEGMRGTGEGTGEEQVDDGHSSIV